MATYTFNLTCLITSKTAQFTIKAPTERDAIDALENVHLGTLPGNGRSYVIDD